MQENISGENKDVSTEEIEQAIGRLVEEFATKPDARENIQAIFTSRKLARQRTKLLADLVSIFQQCGEDQVPTERFTALVQHLGREELFGDQAVTSFHHLRTAIGTELRGPLIGLTVKRTDSGRFYVIPPKSPVDTQSGEILD